MKKKLIILLSVLLSAALLFAIGFTAAKYVDEIKTGIINFRTVKFYFRSDVLVEEEEPDTIEVHGASASFNLSNAANTGKISDVDIKYGLKYYIYKDDAWFNVESMNEEKTLAKGNFVVESAEVSPIEYEGTVYSKVKVEAKSTEPYEKTLRAIFNFNYTPHSLSYSYDYWIGVITLRIVTNDEGGTYEISWSENVLPDNADPNGVLTSAVAGPSSVEATLKPHSNYVFNFFVHHDVREYVEDTLLSGKSDEEINEMMKTNIPCVRK